MKRLISIFLKRKQFFSFAFLRISSMALGLISNIIIVRKLSVEEFGVFSVALLVVNLITTFGFSWSSSSIVYFGSREMEQHGVLTKTFWSRNIIIFSSLLIVTLGIILFRNQINNYIGLNIWYLLILWLYVSVFEDYLVQYFLAVKKQILSSLLSITAKLIYILLIIIIPLDVISLIILYIVGHSSVVLYILGIKKSDIGKFTFDKDWFRKVLNFSLWQLFGFSGIYLLNFGDIAVVKHYMTDADVGIYNAAYQLFIAIVAFSFVVSNYYAPNVSAYFAGHNKEKVKHFYYKERIFIFFICLFGHLLAIILSKPIITALYSDAYLPAVPIFNILMIGSMMRHMTVFYTLYYNTNGKHQIQQTINILVALVNVALSIIFINLFGIQGPAWATVLTIMLSLLFSMYYCERRIKSFIREGV